MIIELYIDEITCLAFLLTQPAPGQGEHPHHLPNCKVERSLDIEPPSSQHLIITHSSFLVSAVAASLPLPFSPPPPSGAAGAGESLNRSLDLDLRELDLERERLLQIRDAFTNEI